MNISVVIPALNEEVIIEECLKSIRRQTHPVELIVIDNGSIDQTPEIAEKYCDMVLIRPEYSLAQMRDLGAIEASGDIIVTTDADCIAPENWSRNLYFGLTYHNDLFTNTTSINKTVVSNVENYLDIII